MSTSNDFTTYINNKTKTCVPASPLDNVLNYNNANITVTLYDFYNGQPLTEQNKIDFYKKVIYNTNNKLYPTTDHLITCVKVNNLNFIYVSLDNSVRANINDNPLYKRLPELCNVVSTIIKSLNNKCIVFFSESCRPSFLGGMDDKQNFTTWLSIRQMISINCNLNFLTEKRNNQDTNSMSFGVSAFYTNDVADEIDTYFGVSLLQESFGSCTVGVQLKSGEIIWGIHFPLDFKGKNKDNLGYKTMVNLQQVLKQYKGSVCAIGDFNTIPGDISDAINDAILPEYKFVLNNELTFFGAYYDTIPMNDKTFVLIDA